METTESLSLLEVMSPQVITAPSPLHFVNGLHCSCT